MAMDTGLIHGESVLLIDLVDLHALRRVRARLRRRPRRRAALHPRGRAYRNWLVPTACYQCTDPVCMMDCPTGAITPRGRARSRSRSTTPTCIGCGNCAKRCPWGNIIDGGDGGEAARTASRSSWPPSATCASARPEGPACVQMCPHGSAVRISFKDMERVVTHPAK